MPSMTDCRLVVSGGSVAISIDADALMERIIVSVDCPGGRQEHSWELLQPDESFTRYLVFQDAEVILNVGVSVRFTCGSEDSCVAQGFQEAKAHDCLATSGVRSAA